MFCLKNDPNDYSVLGWTDPVVSSLVFVIDPVELVVRAVLDAVLGDPLISVTAALREDP